MPPEASSCNGCGCFSCLFTLYLLFSRSILRGSFATLPLVSFMQSPWNPLEAIQGLIAPNAVVLERSNAGIAITGETGFKWCANPISESKHLSLRSVSRQPDCWPYRHSININVPANSLIRRIGHNEFHSCCVVRTGLNLHGSEGRNEGGGNSDKTFDQFAHFVLQIG